MQKGVVDAISDHNCTVRTGGSSSEELRHSAEESRKWQKNAEGLERQHRVKQGIEMGPCCVILHVAGTRGMQQDVASIKLYPLQVGKPFFV
jgi:hypothetical protein